MNKITSPAEHRSLLLSSIEAVAEGRMNVAQANAIVGLSCEVHKSIRQEWDMRVYAAENLSLEAGKAVKMLEVGNGSS
jgi:tRNA U34 5-methylaminomethyl-2-thiouridine-forming methyltransferase MnmC